MFKTQGKSPAKSMPFNRRETMDKAVVVCAGFPPPRLFLFSSFEPSSIISACSRIFCSVISF